MEAATIIDVLAVEVIPLINKITLTYLPAHHIGYTNIAENKHLCF